MSNIEALSLQAYSWGMSTNLLNPPPYTLRKVEDRGSLLASTQDIELFSREKVKDSAWLTYGKPVRAVARVLHTIAVSILVAPIGLIYHAGSAIVRSFMMLQDQDAAKENWQKAKQHTVAFGRDFFVGITGTVAVAYTAVGLAISPFYVFPGALLNITPISNGIWPRFMAGLWHMTDQKAHIFRDEFGLVNQNGGLLTVDRDEDQEDLQFNGQLGLLWKDRCNKLLQTAQVIQRDATQLPYTWPPNGKVIARSMPQDVTLNNVGAGPVSAKAYLKSLQKEIDIAREVLTEYLQERYEDEDTYVKIPVFPINQAAGQY